MSPETGGTTGHCFIRCAWPGLCMGYYRQFIVNLDHIHKYVKGENSYLVMQNQVNIPVARNQKERLTARFGWL